jgi:uncharacterized protein
VLEKEQSAVTDNMIFNVAQLLKEPIGSTRNGEVVAGLFGLLPELESIPLDGSAEPTGPTPTEDVTASEPILKGPVRLMRTQSGVLVQGKLSGKVALRCSRCLDPVVVPLAVDIEEIFTPTINVLTGRPVQSEEQDRALWIDERHILDLGEVIRQDVLLALPMHVLCRDGCRGLCPICGQNLNQGSCSCTPEPDPRWAALLNLSKE